MCSPVQHVVSGSAEQPDSCRRDLYLNPVMQIAHKYMLADIARSLLNIDRLIHMFLIKRV